MEHLEVLAVELEVTTLDSLPQVVLELLCRGLQVVAQSTQVVAVAVAEELQLLAEAQALVVIPWQVAVVLD
jgi:hypothetical protein